MAKLVTVYPHPDLAARLEYLPGVGVDGAELPADEAEDLVARGLAVTTKPKAKPAADAAAEPKEA